MKRKERLVDELNLVQIQIQRTANNSFIIKGWYITFVTTFLAYIITQNKEALIGWGIIPILFSALYDTYFLYLEKLYISKYNWIIENINNDEYLFNLNPYEKNMLKQKISYKNVLFSRCIVCFYFLPILVIILIA